VKRSLASRSLARGPWKPLLLRRKVRPFYRCLAEATKARRLRPLLPGARCLEQNQSNGWQRLSQVGRTAGAREQAQRTA